MFISASSYVMNMKVLTKKLTYRYAFTLLKMKNAEGRNEYMDLAKEANLIWHQIVSQKSKNTPRINCRAQLLYINSLIKRKQDFSQQVYFLQFQSTEGIDF